MAAPKLLPARAVEEGSAVLRKWNEERRLARAVAERQRRGMRRDWWSGVAGVGASGFSGASIGRLTASLAQSSRSVNSDLDGSLVILRSRARSLCANYDYARRFLSLVANNVVGPHGPTLQVRATMSAGQALDTVANEAIEGHWGRWSEVCDVRGQMTLAEMLRVVVKGTARDGEALVRCARAKRLPYGLQLQLLEPDRLDESINRRLSNGNVVRLGVEIDSALQPVAFYVKTSHPGENFVGAIAPDVERIPAGDLYHLFAHERAEQVRGYTWMHAVLLRTAHLQGFEEAAVVAARIGASKMGFFTRTGDPTSSDAIKQLADAQDSATGALQMDAQPGEFIDLPDGYDFKSFDPDYPHQAFGDFVRSCLRGFASGVDVDYASLSNDRSSENYSSIRHGALEARDVWVSLQEWLIRSLVKPVYLDWLGAALLKGDITLPNGKALPAERFGKFADASRFQGRRWAWVDPKNDAEAARLLIEAGLESRTALAAAQGRDFSDIAAELAQEKKVLEGAGLSASFSTASAPAKPAPSDDGDRKIEVHTHQAPIHVDARGTVNVPSTPVQVVGAVEAPASAARDAQLDAAIAAAKQSAESASEIARLFAEALARQEEQRRAELKELVAALRPAEAMRVAYDERGEVIGTERCSAAELRTRKE